MTHRYVYKVQEVLRVVDGDTYDVRIALGFGMSATMRFRLAGVDTPEIYGANATPEGARARDFAAQWLQGRTLVVETFRGSQSAVGVGDGAFGRWLAGFTDTDTGERLADALTDAGLGKHA